MKKGAFLFYILFLVIWAVLFQYPVNMENEVADIFLSNMWIYVWSIIFYILFFAIGIFILWKNKFIQKNIKFSILSVLSILILVTIWIIIFTYNNIPKNTEIYKFNKEFSDVTYKKLENFSDNTLKNFNYYEWTQRWHSWQKNKFSEELMSEYSKSIQELSMLELNYNEVIPLKYNHTGNDMQTYFNLYGSYIWNLLQENKYEEAKIAFDIYGNIIHYYRNSWIILSDYLIIPLENELKKMNSNYVQNFIPHNKNLAFKLYLYKHYDLENKLTSFDQISIFYNEKHRKKVYLYYVNTHLDNIQDIMNMEIPDYKYLLSRESLYLYRLQYELHHSADIWGISE